MKCQTCAKEFIPARRNFQNCNTCIIFKKAKNTEEEPSIEEEPSEPQDDEEESIDDTIEEERGARCIPSERGCETSCQPKPKQTA